MLNSFRVRLRQLIATSSRSSRRRKSHFNSRPTEALEERICPSNLNFAATGQVTFGGSAGNNDLQISVAGDTYTFTDPNETISIIGTNQPGTQSGSGTNTVTFDATTVGLAISRIVINTNGGTDAVTINSFRPGAEGLEIRDTIAADTVNINGDIGTAASRVQTYGVNIAASQINLGADIFTNNLDIALGAAMSGTPVAVTGNSEVDAGTSTVEVNSGGAGVSGAGVNLTINGDSVQTRGDINLTGASDISLNATDLLQVGQAGATSAVISGTGTVSLSGGTQVALTDAVTTGGALSITSPSTTMSNAAGILTGTSVTVSGTLNNTSGNATDIDATAGNVSIGGQLSSTGVVEVSATVNANFDGTVSATDINVMAATVNATSFQASAGSVGVTGDTTFDGVGDVLVSAANIGFLGSVTGNGNNLDLIASMSTDVTGTISNVAELDAQSGGGATPVIALAGITAQNINLHGGLVFLRGDVAATAGAGGSVTIEGLVNVQGASVTVSSGGDVGENILITGTVNGQFADTTALTLNAGTAGNVQITGAAGGLVRLESLALRGDVVTVVAVNVNTDLTVNGGDIRLNGAVTGSGTGTALFAPAVPGGTMDIFNNPANTRVGTNTRIASDTLANIAAGAFADFQFGDAATMILRIHPDANNAVPAGALALSTPTEFQADAIIVSEDLDQGANTLTFETDNLAIYRVAAGTGDVVINKKTPGGTLELRGNLAANTNWGTNAITINAVGATVNAPAAGAPLPILGLGANQPQVNLGGPNASLTINADTLNALASSAIVSSGLLELNVDTLNLTGGTQTVGVGTVTLGNPGAAIENIGGGPFSILLPAGSDLTLEDYDGNGGALKILGVGGQLGTVTLGAISDTGALSLGTSGTNDATILNLTDDITASSIVLRSDAADLDGNLTSTSGNIQLFGPVTLTGDSSLVNTSGLATGLIQVNGTIDGGFALVVNSGPGAALFTQSVGQVTPLDSMTLTTGGVNYVTVPMTVVNAFTWTVGVDGNGINDRIIRVGAGSITSTSGVVTLTADKLQGFTAGVNVSNPNVLTERGAGN